jgi:hypothetical protein
MLKIPKPVFFVSGIVIGGAGAAWIYYALNRPQKTVTSPEKNKIVTENTEVKPDTSLQKLNAILKRNQGEAVTHEIIPSPEETYENIDKNSPLYDSLRQAYNQAGDETTDVSEDEEPVHTFQVNKEVLKKDKLLGRETVKIVSIGENDIPSDSIASKMTGVNPRATTSIEVEHWGSPVNYKGYKLGRTRLVLFGTQPGAITLLRYRNNLYMVFSGKVYGLQSSAGFESLKPLPDKKLSASLLNHVR